MLQEINGLTLRHFPQDELLADDASLTKSSRQALHRGNDGRGSQASNGFFEDGHV
jgi:hypothetical protein